MCQISQEVEATESINWANEEREETIRGICCFKAPKCFIWKFQTLFWSRETYVTVATIGGNTMTHDADSGQLIHSLKIKLKFHKDDTLPLPK